MKKPVLAFALSALACLVGCAGNLAQTALPEQPAAAQQTAQSHLLMHPIVDAESLLGRKVHLTRDGAWTLSDSRVPGCEVRVRREPAVFHSTRRLELNDITVVAIGYAQLLKFKARYGQMISADIDISNLEVLRADTNGACGEYYVDSVFVGTGSRSILARGSVGGDISGQLERSGVSAGGSVEHGEDISVLDTTEWNTPQAYGFTYAHNPTQDPFTAGYALDVDVEMPTVLNDGEEVVVRVKTTKTAYLVIYYLDATSQAQVLWPSTLTPEPISTPGSPAVLPSATETAEGIAIQATLLEPGRPSRETLVVYAFTEKADFDALKPKPGSSATDGAAYAAELTAKLADIPMRRWARVVASYVIIPKQP